MRASKASTDNAWLTSCVRLFHSLVVCGKNDCCLQLQCSAGRMEGVRVPGKNGCHLYDIPQEGRWNNACIMFCRKVG